MCEKSGSAVIADSQIAGKVFASLMCNYKKKVLHC